MDRTGCETAPERIPGPLAITGAYCSLLWLTIIPTVVAAILPVFAAIFTTLALVVASVFPTLLLLLTLPLLVVIAVPTGADDGQRSVAITTRALDDQVAVSVAGATLVDRVVVRTAADLVPAVIVP